MKKMLSTILASAALLGSQAAVAQTWTPATNPWVWQGTVAVQKGSGPLLLCDLTLTMQNPGTGNTTTATASLAPGDPGCATVILQQVGGPLPPPPPVFNVTRNPGPPETFTIHNIFVNTTITPGNCSGSVTVDFNDATDDSLDVNSTLNEVTTGTGHCTIVGNLSNIAPGAGSADIS